jgi:hypothetical protein
MKASVKELFPCRITCRPYVKNEMTYDYCVRARVAPECVMAVAVLAPVGKSVGVFALIARD